MDLNISNRNVYVISDIHNDADGFIELLELIEFSKKDLLIIDGDIFDRGNKPVELYFEILKHPNIQVVQGNHDVWLSREILEKYENEEVGEYISYNSLEILLPSKSTDSKAKFWPLVLLFVWPNKKAVAAIKTKMDSNLFIGCS